MSSNASFSQALTEGVLVFDGPMGTEIYRHHVFTNRCFDELVLSDSKLIRQIHLDYCNAGADVLTTNTFGANRLALETYGLADQLHQINCSGAQLAREVADASGRKVFVAGSIGPLPTRPRSETKFEELILEQVRGLLEGGADFILFETQPTRDTIEKCAAVMQGLPEVPFMISFAMMRNGESASGESIERMLAPLPEHCREPIAWGINCGSGPDGLLTTVEKAVRLTQLPLVVQPNAGSAKEVDSRSIYFCSPEYLATYAKRFVTLGASAVGGCCGTTPDHISEIAKTVKPLTRVASVARMPAETVQLKEPVPFAERSAFAKRLAAGEWVTTVELLPPRGYDLTATIEKSRTLQQHGVNAINIPDGPRASARLSPLITTQQIQDKAGIEAILHFCCRDRNLIGMQADLLACAAIGIRNILFVTGDPPKLGNYPDATGVFDTDSIGMVAVQRGLNQGIDLGGQAIEPKTEAVIGVGLDPTALDPNYELERFRRKVEAGAEFAITQPVFDPDALLSFLDQIEKHSIPAIPIIAGIWPLASYRNALFMQNEVPGVEIPDSIMERMASVSTREDQLRTGVEIAQESVERVRARVAGIQVSAPFGKIETAWSVIETSM